MPHAHQSYPRRSRCELRCRTQVANKLSKSCSGSWDSAKFRPTSCRIGSRPRASVLRPKPALKPRIRAMCCSPGSNFGRGVCVCVLEEVGAPAGTSGIGFVVRARDGEPDTIYRLSAVLERQCPGEHPADRTLGPDLGDPHGRHPAASYPRAHACKTNRRESAGNSARGRPERLSGFVAVGTFLVFVEMTSRRRPAKSGADMGLCVGRIRNMLAQAGQHWPHMEACADQVRINAGQVSNYCRARVAEASNSGRASVELMGNMRCRRVR